MQTVHPGSKSDRTLFTVGKMYHMQPVWVENKLFHRFWSSSFLSLSVSLLGKTKNQNSNGIFKVELESAGRPSKVILSLLRASRARSSGRGNGFCVWFTSSDNVSTLVSLAKKHTGGNPPVLQANKDQIHRAAWSLAIIHTY